MTQTERHDLYDILQQDKNDTPNVADPQTINYNDGEDNGITSIKSGDGTK